MRGVTLSPPWDHLSPNDGNFKFGRRKQEEAREMGKYVEMLDTGAKIANRIRAHYPQTSGLYYHPPTNGHDVSGDSTMSNNATYPVEPFSSKVYYDEMDTKDLILFVVIG
ncbi:hypothetical protein T459_19003 [Capsicum annuum]|uniref:Uncharacterized protein n=1 Tax=Capsicum annuum TaxID=4072 RepID=A0A2G2Z0Q9_CAPAN|nr:hypothetical protein T459_19003 [Capsicum annuum]